MAEVKILIEPAHAPNIWNPLPPVHRRPREGEILPFKKGFAHFAFSAGVPVVPIGLSGPKDIWLGKRIRVYIGEPIPAAGKTVDEMHRVGAEAVARLLPPYREPAGPKLLRRWLTGLF